MHKRMEFKISGAYEQQDMGLASKTEYMYMVLFYERRLQ